MKLNDKTIDFLINVLDKEIDEEYSYLVNGMGGEDKTYIKDLITSKNELYKLKAKSSFDLMLANTMMQEDLKKLEELK